MIILFLTGLAMHDVATRQVPNTVLIMFAIFAIPAPAITAVFSYTGFSSLTAPVMRAVLGVLFGFVPLLVAAMLSKDGMGIGGGDIKLAAILGYIFGPVEIILIILIASFAAIVYSLIIRLICKRKTISVPFVPFILFGSLVIIAGSQLALVLRT